MDTMSSSDLIKALPLGLYSQTPFAAFKSRSQMMATAHNEFRDIYAGAARGHFDQTMSAWQAVATAGSVKDAVTAQTNYIYKYCQTTLNRSNDVIQAFQRLAQAAMTPMTLQPADTARTDA